MSHPFFHQDVPVYVRLAQVVGISTTFAIAGTNLSTSFLSMPAFMKAPAPLLAEQWSAVYNKGAVTIPPLTVVASAAFASLAIREYRLGTSALWTYATAAVVGVAVIPFTFFVMMPTNKALLAKADSTSSATAGDAAEEAKGGDESTHALADRWTTFNFVRGVTSTVAGLVGLWAALQPVEVVGIGGFEFTSGANRLG